MLLGFTKIKSTASCTCINQKQGCQYLSFLLRCQIRSTLPIKQKENFCHYFDCSQVCGLKSDSVVVYTFLSCTRFTASINHFSAGTILAICQTIYPLGASVDTFICQRNSSWTVNMTPPIMYPTDNWRISPHQTESVLASHRSWNTVVIGQAVIKTTMLIFEGQKIKSTNQSMALSFG